MDSQPGLSSPQDVSVAIVNYHSLNYLSECLKTWKDGVEEISAELVVVENGTGEPVQQFVEQLLPGTKVVTLKESISFSGANNEALRQGRGRYYVLLNPDTLLVPGSFKKAVQFLNQHPEVAILGPRVWDDAGKTQIQRSWRRFPTVFTAFFNRYSILSRIWPRNPWTQAYLMQDHSPEETQDCDWVSGCCMFIRADFYQQCGGLDPGYPLYCEDVDICRQAKERGHRVVYFPQAEVVHLIAGSSRKAAVRSIWFRHRSMQHYILKYQGKLNPLAWVLVAGVWVRFAASVLVAKLFP